MPRCAPARSGCSARCQSCRARLRPRCAAGPPGAPGCRCSVRQQWMGISHIFKLVLSANTQVCRSWQAGREFQAPTSAQFGPTSRWAQGGISATLSACSNAAAGPRSAACHPRWAMQTIQATTVEEQPGGLPCLRVAAQQQALGVQQAHEEVGGGGAPYPWEQLLQGHKR